MEVPDFLNVDCSEDEDADDAAELEAHLYSKIYYEDIVGDVETSVKLYTEEEEKRPPDSGLGSSREEETFSSHNSTPIISNVIINNEVISINDDVTGGDSDDVIVIDSDDEVTGSKQPQTVATSSPLLQSKNQTNKSKIRPLNRRNAETEKNQPGTSKTSDVSATRKSQFHDVDEFISNVFDINKLKEKNPFYVDSDDDDDDNESDTTETTEESEDVVLCSSSSGNETSRYTENNKTTATANESSRQHLGDEPKRSNKMSESSSSSSSEEDEGIQILREVDVALERSLRAEVVDLIESENSELELEDVVNNRKTVASKKQSKASATPATAEVVKANPILSREKARSGKIVVESTPAKKSISKPAKKRQHFVAQMDFSSDSSSSSSSESEPSFSVPSRLSLNLSGGNIGRGGGLLRAGQKSFREITGMSPGSHRPSKNKFASWTPEMAQYYDELDPEMADVTVDDLIASLPDGANWSVGARDRYSSPGARGGRRRYFNSPGFMACSVCGQKGHRPDNCTRRGQEQRKCYMCGGDDHSKFSCPKMMCLRCGQPGMPYTSTCNRCRHVMETDCHHCGGRGHLARNCPDHWRRYHLTTEPGHIVKPDNVSTDYAAIWCPNCSRRGHYVHQCRAFSSSQHPKSVLSVVSYEERRKRKFVVEEQQQEDVFRPKQSDSGQRKRLKLELKEKRRAYKSFPRTPTGAIEKTGPNKRRNISEPASPIDPNLNLSVFSVTRNLTEAKEKLIQMTKEKFSGKKKRKEKKRINPRGELQVTPKQFPKKSHEPQSFPRGGGGPEPQSFPRGPGSRKRPRHNTEFSPHTEPTDRNRRSVERMVEWKNRRKAMRLKKKGGENENFIKI